MKTRKPSILTVSIILMLAMSVVLVFAVPAIGIKHTDNADTGANRPIEIIGSYQVGDGPWMELTKDTLFDSYSDNAAVTVKGRFSREIPEGQHLLFYIQRLFVSLKIDGDEVYAFGNGSSYSSVLKVPGTTFADYVSPGISAGSEIELVMRGTQDNAPQYFRMIIHSMQTGSHAGLYKQMFVQNGYALVFCMLLIFISIVALLLAVIAYFWRVPHSSKALALSFFAATGALALLTDLNHWYMPLLITNPVALCIFEIMILYLIPNALILCILSYAGERARPVIKAACTVMCTLTAVLFLLQSAGVVQLYKAQRFFWPVSLMLAAVSIVVFIYHAFKYNERESKLILLTILPAAFFLTLDAFNYLFSLKMLTFSFGVSITLMLQFFYIINMIKQSSDMARQRLQLENELTQSRISVMLSQIQPHFLYNSLAAISRLCDKDPAEAKKVTIEFATYLRGNMDSLDETEPILFERELRHVEGFLNLEKAMYEDALNVVYDIKAKGFPIPVLSLQPIVENAVKHGIGKKEGGGTVTISTDETENAYLVIVSDDGMGFDYDINSGDGQSHIGINNVRQRLYEQCGGSLQIESQKEKGTTVTMQIPKSSVKGGVAL